MALVLVVTATTLAACSAPTPVAARRPPAATTTSTAPASSAPTSGTPGATGREGVPAFAHIFVVVMENLGAQAAMAVPSLATLAHRYQSTTQWLAASHPSLPNYLALVSGQTWGVQSDCTSCYQRGTDLADQLTAAGVSWGAYFEGMPAPCYLGPSSADGSYAEKHDPFAYFEDLRSSAAACAHLQPLGSLVPLLSGPAAAVPRFVWVTPSMCHSGHDCPATAAADWLQRFVTTVTASAAWQDHGLLVVTWDEGDTDAGVDPASGLVRSGGGGGPVLAIVAAPGMPAGRTPAGAYSHYSLLRTVEDALGLAWLAHAGDAGVRPLTAFFAGG